MIETAKGDVVQLARYAGGRLWARLDGLADDEYFWPPVPGAWTLRLVDGVWRGDAGPDGTPFSAPDPAPVTDIAWRLWHLGAVDVRKWPPSDVVDGIDFARQWFEGDPADPAIGDAAGAVAALRRNWEDFTAILDRLPDSELARPMGEVGGRYAESSVFGLVLHAIDEFIHHGAEIGVLRDLYARS